MRTGDAHKAFWLGSPRSKAAQARNSRRRAALRPASVAYFATPALPGYVMERLGGALRKLLDDAIASKAIRSDVNAEELFWTVATMCRGPFGEKPAYAEKMVDVFIDGLRFRASV